MASKILFLCNSPTQGKIGRIGAPGCKGDPGDRVYSQDSEKFVLYFYIVWSNAHCKVCVCDVLKGPDGHPGNVGEGGTPGADGEKVMSSHV